MRSVDGHVRAGTEGRTRRILYCSTALTFGGELKQMSQVLGHLDRSRFEPSVCCIRQSAYSGRMLEDMGVPLFRLGMKGKYNVPLAVWRMRRVIRQRGIDLLQMGIFGSEFTGLLAAAATRIPAVAVLQTTYDLGTRSATVGAGSLAWRLKWRTIYMVHGLLARAANVRYVALSEAVKESAVKELRLPAERVSVIPLGLDPEQFDGGQAAADAAKKVRAELSLNGAYPVLLNVARLSAVKGQKDLLQVMARVVRRFPQARLLVAGDGPLLPELEDIRDGLGLHDHVLLLGRRDDVDALLHTSDLFVFGSHYEGLPGAVVEAMATGKCVVSFDIPPMRAVIEDGRSGVLVGGRDVERFAEAVVRMAEHPEAARSMGEQARRIAKEKYDIRRNVRSLEALYLELTPERGQSLRQEKKQNGRS